MVMVMEHRKHHTKDVQDILDWLDSAPEELVWWIESMNANVCTIEIRLRDDDTRQAEIRYSQGGDDWG